MSDFTKITLTIAIVLGIIALGVYAYLSTEKLKDQKVSKVESNIEQHLNNEVEELYDNEVEDSEEDMSEGIVEDDDFEEYIEPEAEDWIEEDTIDTKPEPVAVTPPPATVTPNNQSPILLIAGSYKSRSNAISKVKRMEKLGLKAEIVQLEGSDLYSVSIGSFDTEAAAEQSGEQIKSDLKVKSFVYKKEE